MKTKDVWPVIDLTLAELDPNGDEGISHSSVKQEPERPLVLLNDLNFISNAGKCHDRYSMPGQVWNIPVILAEDEGKTGQNGGTRKRNHSTDAENSHSVSGLRDVKTSDVKGGVAFGNDKPSSTCVSGDKHESNGLSALRTNSHDMTGVSIGLSMRRHRKGPYEVPWRREERVGTRSETAKKEAALKLIDGVDVSLDYPVADNYTETNNAKRRRGLFKPRSRENVRLAEDEILQVPVHEMDSMSN